MIYKSRIKKVKKFPRRWGRIIVYLSDVNSHSSYRYSYPLPDDIFLEIREFLDISSTRKSLSNGRDTNYNQGYSGNVLLLENQDDLFLFLLHYGKYVSKIFILELDN